MERTQRRRRNQATDTAMNTQAAIYLRSSKDRSDVSIDAQRRQLHELAMARGLTIVDEFADAVFSGKDDDRPGFQRLLYTIKRRDRSWRHILALDTSRIARRQHLALFFENECERQGIKVVYASMPDGDPLIINLLKSFLQAMDQWHSMVSRAKGLAGMKENVMQGWRAGGRAPRGYYLEYVPTGAIRDGEPVMKSRLAPDADAPRITQYLKGRANGESRAALARLLGFDSSVSSLHGLEWQALTYAGHTVWNMHNEKNGKQYVGNVKRRPRSEWVIKENTHPALITTEEAERILARLDRTKNTTYRIQIHHYLLTGMLEAPDGTKYTGEWDKKSDSPIYRVGSRGKRVAAHRIDRAVMSSLEAHLTSDEFVTQMKAQLTARMAKRCKPEDVLAKRAQMKTLERKVHRWLEMLAKADDTTANLYHQQVMMAEAERAELQASLDEASRAQDEKELMALVTDDNVRQLMKGLLDDVKSAAQTEDIELVKTALAGIVDHIVLDPASDEAQVHLRPMLPLLKRKIPVSDRSDTGIVLASPRGFEPRYSP